MCLLILISSFGAAMTLKKLRLREELCIRPHIWWLAELRSKSGLPTLTLPPLCCFSQYDVLNETVPYRLRYLKTGSLVDDSEWAGLGGHPCWRSLSLGRSIWWINNLFYLQLALSSSFLLLRMLAHISPLQPPCLPATMPLCSEGLWPSGTIGSNKPLLL